jgi:hypothetical protein
MFLLTMFAGVVLAPLSYELYRARGVAADARLIQEMGGKYYLNPRRNDFSAWLAVRIWPVADEFLGKELSQVYFPRGPEVDLSPLTHVSELSSLKVSSRVTFRDTSFRHLAVKQLDFSEGWSEFQYANEVADFPVLGRFPNVEKISLWRMVPNQTLIDDLSTCRNLRSLEICFTKPIVIMTKFPTDPLRRVDLAPLGQLSKLERLRIVSVAEGTDWSFMSKLGALEDISVCPAGTHTIGGSVESWTKYHGPLPAMVDSPFHHLCLHTKLKRVELLGTPAYAADIERLVADSQIEELRLDLLPDGVRSLEALRNADSLHRLEVHCRCFGNDQQDAEALLEDLGFRYEKTPWSSGVWIRDSSNSEE